MVDSFDGSDEVPLISRGQLRSARQLLSRKNRQERGEFLVEGTQAVREALRDPSRVMALLVDDPRAHAELIDMADPDLPVLGLTREDALALSDTVTPQGVFAVVSDPAVELADISGGRLVVICAQVRDPGNAGTVIRCADAFGADAVVLTAGSVELTNPKTVRASVGSVFHLPIATAVDFAEAVDWAHAAGMTVLAADAGGEDLAELARTGQLDGPTAWVMGNEAWGLPEDVLALVDRVVSIPMPGQAESLNLSTAAAVCLYASSVAQREAR